MRLYGKARKQQRRFNAAVYWAERMSGNRPKGLSPAQIEAAETQFLYVHEKLTPKQRELLRTMFSGRGKRSAA